MSTERSIPKAVIEERKVREEFYSQDKACKKYFTYQAGGIFPFPPSHGSDRTDCIRRERLKNCHHELEKTHRGIGYYAIGFLRSELQRWISGDSSSRLEHDMFMLIQFPVDEELARSEEL